MRRRAVCIRHTSAVQTIRDAHVILIADTIIIVPAASAACTHSFIDNVFVLCKVCITYDALRFIYSSPRSLFY